MARIPDEQLERLKTEVSVERLVTGSGIELRRSGKDWVARWQLLDNLRAGTPKHLYLPSRETSHDPRGAQLLSPPV
jgi:hypothetical protein